MRRRPLSEDLASANMQYLAAWLGSWPIRRRLKRSRRTRYEMPAPLPEMPRTAKRPG